MTEREKEQMKQKNKDEKASTHSFLPDKSGREEAQTIEKKTRQQAEWKYERRKRITASRVGGIVLVLYSTFRGNEANEATRYGSEKEEQGRTNNTSTCGLRHVACSFQSTTIATPRPKD